MKILVVGLGYKGLSLGLYVADRCRKATVVGFDINKSLINKLRGYNADFAETGIMQYLKKYLNKNFILVDSLPKENFDIVFVCVGPQLINNKISLGNFKNAIRSTTKVISRKSVLAIRRNLPVGYTRKFVSEFLKKEGKDALVVFAPERTNRELALKELRFQPQLIGCDADVHLKKVVPKLKKIFPSLVTLDSFEEAEFTILCSHFHSYWLYSYANIISDICSYFNFDTNKIISMANKDFTDRFDIDMPIRPKIHRAGYIGGSGLNIDLILFLESFKEGMPDYFSNIALLKRHNDFIPNKVVDSCMSLLKDKGELKRNIKIGICGFGYKGKTPTSDYRFSLTVAILGILRDKKFNNIYIHDPVISRDKVEAFGAIYCSNLDECFRGSSVVFMSSDHKYYKDVERKKYNKCIRGMTYPRVVFDTCDIFYNKNIDLSSIFYLTL